MNRWLRKGENWGPGAPRREYSDKHWEKPLRWNDQAAAAGEHWSVFPSVCDPFDNAAPDGARNRFWLVVEATPHLTWLLLTKRIGNVLGMVPPSWLEPGGWPKNVWLGATIVNQEEADRDIPKLLAVPARVRFLSMEPLLSAVDLTPHLWGRPKPCDDCPKDADCECGYARRGKIFNDPALHWVIVGGESGPKARPMHPDWARSLRDQCAGAGTPLLFKQHGEWIGVPDLRRLPDGGGPGFGAYDHCRHDPEHDAVRVGKKAAGRLLDGVEHNGYPEVV
jgi:protein gp37